MATTAPGHGSEGFVARYRIWRRNLIKQSGKRLIRGLAQFFANQSLVGNEPVYPLDRFPAVKPLEANWKAIRAELDEVLKHREEVPAFQEISPDQKRIAKGDKWKTFILYGFGTKFERHCAKCPETTKLLEQVPNLQTAWFSIMGPGYHVPAHSGVTKSILRCHLGLIVPREREKCRMRVDKEICVWEEGKAFVFDDTFNHEVWNETDDDRVILLFDFTRPMRFWGRVLNRLFVITLKMTAYYQDPKRNMKDAEQRFEDATRRADKAMEGLGDTA